MRISVAQRTAGVITVDMEHTVIFVEGARGRYVCCRDNLRAYHMAERPRRIQVADSRRIAGES